jgi:protein-arginine kinase activator protein McsA
MTREEAIKILQKRQRFCKVISDHANATIKADELQEVEAIDMAISTLCPVSREQVEKVWRGEWIVQQDEHKEYIKRCSKCGFPISGWWGADKFCANCGAPMTDEAVEMVMKRWEGMKDGSTTN